MLKQAPQRVVEVNKRDGTRVHAVLAAATTLPPEWMDLHFYDALV